MTQVMIATIAAMTLGGPTHESYDQVVFLETHIHRPQLLGFGQQGTHQIEREIILKRRNWFDEFVVVGRINVDEFPAVERHGKRLRFAARYWKWVGYGGESLLTVRRVECDSLWVIEKTRWEDPE